MWFIILQKFLHLVLVSGSFDQTLERLLRSLHESEGLGPTTSHIRLDQVHTDVITKIILAWCSQLFTEYLITGASKSKILQLHQEVEVPTIFLNGDSKVPLL